ncbi:hypothetical protein J6590_039640 [Homalodisca vitripennis]|nr:hypothetical protein J6590_039640 [Homalodisca vitripennis]
MGVPIAERSKNLDFESELEIAQVRILSVTVALFISTIDLVLYQLSLLFCLIRCSHMPVAHEDGQNHSLSVPLLLLEPGHIVASILTGWTCSKVLVGVLIIQGKSTGIETEAIVR